MIRRRLLTVSALVAALLLLTGAGEPDFVGRPASTVTGSMATSAATASMASRTTVSMTSRATCSTMIKSRPSGSVKGISGTRENEQAKQPMTAAPEELSLSPYAEELAKIVKFDRQVLLIIKELTREPVRRLVGYDQDDYQIVAPGIAVPVSVENTDFVLETLRKKLRPLGYRPYKVEMNSGTKVNKIGVIKDTDPYEILRIMHTTGDEYGISNQEIIDRLQEWERISSFTIIGADTDWIEIEFITLPQDLKSFVNEVSEFSPDTLTQKVGTVEKLMKEILRKNRLVLLWE